MLAIGLIKHLNKISIYTETGVSIKVAGPLLLVLCWIIPHVKSKLVFNITT